MMAAVGSVYQRQDGRWVAVYSLNGKRKMVYGKTKEDAILKRQRVLDELNGSLCMNDVKTSKANVSVMPLGEWLNKWLITYIKPYKSASTYTGYEVYINKHVIPALGGIQLCALNPKIFQQFFYEKSKNGRLDGKPGGMSPKSMENMKFMLVSALRKAVENELIVENHASSIITDDIIKKEAVALSTDEEARLIVACKKYHNISAFGIIMALSAGLQIGELLALQWTDIDMVNKSIHVKNLLNRRFDTSDETETRSTLRISAVKARRVIKEGDLPVDFFSDIELYMNRQKNLFGNVPDVVLASWNGGFIDPGNYNKLFKRILRKSGIKNVNFDILQNTYALRFLERGCNPSELYKVLGCIETSKSIKKYISIYEKNSNIT